MSRHWDRIAAVYGVDVFEMPAAPLKGCFFPEQRAIVIRAELEAAERDLVLGHEVGHLVLGHQPTVNPVAKAEQEAAATAWAAENEGWAKRARRGCQRRTAESL